MAGMMAPTCQWCLDSLLSFELSVLLSPSRSMQFLELVPSPGLAFAPSLLLLLALLLLLEEGAEAVRGGAGRSVSSSGVGAASDE